MAVAWREWVCRHNWHEDFEEEKREIGVFGKGDLSCRLLVTMEAEENSALVFQSMMLLPEPQCYCTIVSEFLRHVSGEIRNVKVNK